MYKNNILISNLVKIAKTTDFSNVYKNSGVSLNANYNDFTSSIIETPNYLFNYKYNGTDISTYCIATWVDSNSGFSSLPSWCTKIRAVLIGGGGAGCQGEFSKNNQTNTHINNNIQTSRNHNHDNQDVFFGQSGGGGGGGGFVFLNTTNASQVSVQLGIGGQANGESGTATTLIINGSTVVKALGGGGAVLGTDGTATTGGSGGQTQGGSIVANGNNGTVVPAQDYIGIKGGALPGGQQYINSGELKKYGVGGGGTASSYYTTTRTYTGQESPHDFVYNFPSNITYQAGSDGYYRIYFLSN
jgi:hypothetical protein